MAVTFTELLLPGEQLLWQADATARAAKPLNLAILLVAGGGLIAFAAPKLFGLLQMAQQVGLVFAFRFMGWRAVFGPVLICAAGLFGLYQVYMAVFRKGMNRYALSTGRAFHVVEDHNGTITRVANINCNAVMASAEMRYGNALFVPVLAPSDLSQDDGDQRDEGPEVWTFYNLSDADHQAGLAQLNKIMGAAAL